MRSTQAASTIKTKLCSFLQGLPMFYNTTRVADILQYIADLTEWDGAGLSTWEAGKIFEAFTAEKAAGTPRDLGAIVQGALALLVSAVAPKKAPYGTSLEVFKAAMMLEAKPGGDTDSGSPSHG